jgi:RimJ/RimL family protein N-acetyltransferase
MQKAGMKEEGMQRQMYFRKDRYRDAVLYGILRSEWESPAP